MLGCYYLTASRGEEGEKVEAGDGMIFHSPGELFSAYAEGKLGLHARIKVRLPHDKKVIAEVKDERGGIRAEELPRKPNGLVATTVGRVDLQRHPATRRWRFYNLALSSKNLARIIADCYQLLGRRETISLLDRMKETGFRESTRSGLCFATSDLHTPATKEEILKQADKEVDKVRKQYERGIITEQERYNQVIDIWTKAREQITKSMMDELQGGPPRRQAVLEPDLPHGPLRRPWRHRADPPARRHARPDGQAVRARSSRRRSSRTSAKA